MRTAYTKIAARANGGVDESLTSLQLYSLSSFTVLSAYDVYMEKTRKWIQAIPDISKRYLSVLDDRELGMHLML